MAKRILILLAFCLIASLAHARGGEYYPAPSAPDIVTANIGTSDTTVTSSVTGYWYVEADTDVHYNYGAAATTTHPKIQANTAINLFPIRIHNSSSSRTPNEMHFIAATATGDIRVQVISQ